MNMKELIAYIAKLRKKLRAAKWMKVRWLQHYPRIHTERV